MNNAQIAEKIKQLTIEAQNRINQIVKQDPVWQNIQGQIGAYQAVLDAETPEPQES